MADNKVLATNSPEKCNYGDSKDTEMADEGEIFEVEKIIGKSKLKGKVIYKVRWKGYGPADDTWEPADNLDTCQDLIEEYTAKQSELAKKRAEDRRNRKAMSDNQDGASDNSEHSPYPPNFKNSFWKELEAGRVNLFDNDMYSKVKKRAVPKLKQSPSEPTCPKSCDQSKQKKRRTVSDPEKKVPQQEDDRKSKSASKVPVLASLSQKEESSSSRKIEFDSQSSVFSDESTEVENDDHESEAIAPMAPDTDSSDSEAELEKPALNIVIRKDSLCNVGPDKQGNVVKYSVVQRKLSDIKRADKRTSSESSSLSECSKVLNTTDSCLSDDSNTDLMKRKKKKKQHKHRKHKSRREFKLENIEDITDKDRKRNEAETSLINLEACTSGDLDKLEAGTTEGHSLLEPCTSEEHSQLEACNFEGHSQLEACTSEEPIIKVPKLETISVLDNPAADDTGTFKGPEKGLDSISVKEESDIVTHVEKNISDCTDNGNQEIIAQSSSSSQNDSRSYSSLLSHPNDLNLKSCDRSHPGPIITSEALHSTTSKELSFMDVNSLVHCSTNNATVILGGQDFPEIKSEIQRQDSETVDSGIASPASEKSIPVTQQELMQPLDDIFGQSVLPLLPDTDHTQERSADNELDIDLDEMDWDLFNKDVRLETITLTNSEFARAVIMGDFELVKQSVTGSGKYDLEQPDPTGKTLLMCAVHSLYDDIAELLIGHGANIDAQTKTGVTALMIACQHGEIGMVNLLLERGAKVNPRCVTGESALIIAAKRGHSQILWLLLECGANFNQMSCTGHTRLSDLRALQYRDPEGILASHIQRVMSEFDRQVAATLNFTTSLVMSIFPAQVFNLCESGSFQVKFNYGPEPQHPSLGQILFVGHAMFSSQEVRCRFYGPCAVQMATLNGQQLTPLTQEGNFVLTFSPLLQGKNVLTLNTVKVPQGKAKLIVCAYKTHTV